MWPRSPVKIGSLARNLRATERQTSRRGRATAMAGAANATTVAEVWLQMIPYAPSRKPISKLPESPRKIDAGLKL